MLTKRGPRWLVENGHMEEAKQSLAWLRAAEPTDVIVVDELRGIEEDAQKRRLATSQTWTVLFTNRPLFNRLWRASLLQFMAQMCGNTSMKYYLPTILMNLGIERKMALMIGGIETTLKIWCTLLDTWLVDRYGRRVTLLVSCLIMSIALMVSRLSNPLYIVAHNKQAKWRSPHRIPRQHESQCQLRVYFTHLYLHLWVLNWVWSSCLGLWLRGKYESLCEFGGGKS